MDFFIVSPLTAEWGMVTLCLLQVCVSVFLSSGSRKNSEGNKVGGADGYQRKENSSRVKTEVLCCSWNTGGNEDVCWVYGHPVECVSLAVFRNLGLDPK